MKKRALFIKSDGLTRLSRVVTPPMGVLHLAAVLREERDWEVRIADMRVPKKSPQDLLPLLKDFTPHIVGISAITQEAASLQAVAAAVKAFDPSIRVVAGGPHPTSYPEEVLEDPAVDAIVLGEGEVTMVELFNTLLDGGNLDQVKGIAFRGDGGVVTTASRPVLQDLDSLPFPAWDLIDFTPYAHMDSMAAVGFRKYAGLFTSRACPYQCIYCHKMFGKRFRARSPEAVVEHVRYLHTRYGIRNFEVYDDVFNLDRNRSQTIFALLGRAGFKDTFAFPNGLRCDLLDEEGLKIYKEGGANFISIPVETASPRLQAFIKKNLNLQRVRTIIEACARMRIFTRGFFMLGFPTETREEILQTIQFARTSKLHSALFFIVTPFKGTEIEKRYGDKNNTQKVNFKNYNYFTAPFNMSECNDKDLFQLQRYAMWTVNTNLKKVWRMFRDHPNKPFIFYDALRFLTLFPYFIIKENRYKNMPA